MERLVRVMIVVIIELLGALIEVLERKFSSSKGSSAWE